jgi:SH3-like domain-containing protein
VNAPPSGAVWLYEDPDASARKMVAVPPDAKGLVADRCLQNWCHVTFRGATGWVERNNIQPTCN